MKFITLCIVALMAPLAFSADHPPAPVEGVSFVRTVGAVSEYRLDSNGLQILLVTEHSAPVVTFMVTYRVGSRNEVTGTTGATHLLEHLMFKGTERFDRSKGTGLDQVIERIGADTNATTWLDRTNYFATVPTNALPLLIELEADRMRHLALREEDRRPEMVVVRNEFERGENQPSSALDKELWAAAFQAHPYHHDTIGWRSDIEKVPIEKLRAFYDTFYWPNNATATVIGDIDPVATLEEIKKHYGAITKSPQAIPQVYTEEPAQTGPRRVSVKRSGELGLVAIAHKIPQALHPDWPALEVMSAVLTMGKTSRCYRALTDKNLTIDVNAHVGFNLDPTLHTTYAEMTPGTKHEDVERKLVTELERLKKDGVTVGEVQTAIAQLLAERAHARDGTYARAEELNECIAVGDWTLSITLDEKIAAVTADDVKRVANAYLDENRSVTGWFIPTEGNTTASPAAKADEAHALKTVVPPKPLEKELAPPAATNFAQRVVRENVAGLDLLVCPTEVKEVVSLRGSLAAGDGTSPNPVIPHLVAEMLERGTTKHDQFAIADLLEKAGVTLDFNVNSETVEFEARLLKKDIPLVVSILAEELRTPAFTAAEFAKAKKQLVAETQQMLEDPNTQAAIAFSQAIYPVGHPSRRLSVPEFVTALQKAKVEEARAFHAAAYGPASLHVVAAGDVDAALLKAEVAKAFAGWKGGRGVAEAAAAKAASGEKTVQMPDKSSVSVVIGQSSGLQARDPDWLALNVATAVFGRGFTSRLVGNVRDREGLTYGIGASLSGDTFRPGSWQIKASFSPILLERGLTSIRRELTSWWEQGVTADELAYRQSALSGQFAVALETTHGLAEQLLRCVERGFEASWMDEFPGKVRALTLDQVNTAVKTHLDPAKTVTVRAGTVK